MNKYNLDKKQMIKFNKIYKETEKLYPHLVVNEINIERTKTLIAYSILNDDKPIEIENNEIIVKEDKEDEEEHDKEEHDEEEHDEEEHDEEEHDEEEHDEEEYK